nr:NAD-dependent epimerase/dehydratase family protein [Pelomicrobium methylotrophicum]
MSGVPENRVLVTGVAGFIGAALAGRLLADGHAVTGVDNLSPYYGVALKRARLAALERHPAFSFLPLDLADRAAVARLFDTRCFDAIVHLAAQPGVRYSMENPAAYIDANLAGFGNVLEGARRCRPAHLMFASSSSVYGEATAPFSENQCADRPLSLYAATKRANELMAYSYAHLHRLPCTGLRFFTVYGPWMRPDMAIYRFAEGIVAGHPIPVFNRGQMRRDYTYIDDAVEAVVRLLRRPPQASGTAPPYRVLNIGNHQPVELTHVIALLERHLGRRATLELLPMQPGDVHATCADVTALREVTGFVPSTPIDQGIARFAEWFLARRAGRGPAVDEAATSQEGNPCA